MRNLRKIAATMLAVTVSIAFLACGSTSADDGNVSVVAENQTGSSQATSANVQETSKSGGNIDAAQAEGGSESNDKTEAASEAASEEIQTEAATQPPHTVHSYVATAIAATCEENGKIVYRCSVCGDSYEETDEGSPALGHNYTSNVITVTATQYSPGVRQFICGVCGGTKDLAYGYAHKVVAYDGVHTVYGYWDTSCEQEIFNLLNEYRVSLGLKALSKTSVMTETAHQRALEIAYSYRHNHSRPTNQSWRTAYPDDNLCGENIASGQADAQEVTTGWIESSAHEENMSSTTFRQVGIGVFVRVDCPESGEVTTPDPEGLSHEDYRYYVQSFAD